jgi:hypothetical protein
MARVAQGSEVGMLIATAIPSGLDVIYVCGWLAAEATGRFHDEVSGTDEPPAVVVPPCCCIRSFVVELGSTHPTPVFTPVGSS